MRCTAPSANKYPRPTPPTSTTTSTMSDTTTTSDATTRITSGSTEDLACLVLRDINTVIGCYERFTHRFNALLSVPNVQFNDIDYSNAMALIISANHMPQVKQNRALARSLSGERLQEVLALLEDVGGMLRGLRGLQTQLEMKACLYKAAKEMVEQS